MIKTCPNCGIMNHQKVSRCNCGFAFDYNQIDRSDSTSSIAANAAGLQCFAVSLFKLAVLSVCTLGLYDLYWFYKNWQIIRAREKSSILPFWRTFFSILFCYACFSRIRDQGSRVVVGRTFAAGPLALGWICTTLLWRLPDPYWLVSLFSFVFLLPVQAHANLINNKVDPRHDANDKFTAWNWVGIVVGGTIAILAVIGTFFFEEP